VKALLEPDHQVRRAALGSVAGFLAFGFGSGLSRFAPGTMGTIVAIPFVFLLKPLPEPIYWALLALSFLLGVYLCGKTAKQLGQHDPGGIVFDEMVAYWLTASFIPAEWPWLLAAFILFRLFDILKPWPIRQSETMFSGGLGIMVDDIIAALYAMAVLAAFQFLLVPVFAEIP
jgi:phosphatidylglycerophosphatase A